MTTVTTSVLLVTYLPDERQLYGDALRAAKFAVRVFDDPVRALEEAMTHPPDVLVTRIMQPGCALDGIELTRRIRSDPRTRATSVVVITSHIEPAYRTAALEAGCHSYILLPCLPDALVAQVAGLASDARRRPQRAESL